jgi:hypothetical protein
MHDTADRGESIVRPSEGTALTGSESRSRRQRDRRATPTGQRHVVRLLASVLATIALLVCLGAVATQAHATDQHVFDARLSLTGACTPSALDSVADPGCPYLPPGAGGPRPFSDVCGTATDRHGYVYVASTADPFSANGRIDVFDGAGRFVTEIEVGPKDGLIRACGLAVDSQGRIYVAVFAAGAETGRVVRYTPKAYPPHAELEAYGAPEPFGDTGAISGVAVDPSDDHVFVSAGPITEYTPAGAVVGGGFFGDSTVDVAVWGRNHDVYTTITAEEVRIYDGTSHALKETIPAATQDTAGSGASISVDQENGDFYVSDVRKYHRVNHYSKGAAWSCAKTKPIGAGEWGCVEEVTHSLELSEFGYGSDPAIDTPCLTATKAPCPGTAPYDSPHPGHLFVTSAGKDGASHLYAFAPLEIGPPEVSAQGASQVSTTTATLGGQITPHGAVTACRIEYTDQTSFEEKGYAGATSVPCGGVAAEAPATAVSAAVEGLKPETAYRFRIVAVNHCNPLEEAQECVTKGEGKAGGEGTDASFATYMEPFITASCPNEALRVGPSAALPDCRAYELVSPPDSGGIVPVSVWKGFDASLVDSSGESLVFGSETGALPSSGGNGLVDAYEARRDPASGWRSRGIGPSGAQAHVTEALSLSPDHGYSLWSVWFGFGGSLGVTGPGAQDFYIRVPEGVRDPNCSPEPQGSFELVGCGSLNTDTAVGPLWISAGAAHLIFTNGGTGDPNKPLEPCAPPEGTRTIYDRSPGGPTHCVSLLPGDITPAAGENASYLGASEDGRVVAFDIGAKAYVRLGDAETLEVGEGISFAGLSRDGARLFYLKGGDIFALDTATKATVQVGSGGGSTLVNVSADGSRVYFASPKQLDGSKGTAGQPNLYVWDGSSVRFIATLDAADFEGNVNLGKWVIAGAFGPEGPAAHAGSALDPSRSTPDGSVLLFQSHASLARYPNKGYSELYRYDASAGGGAGSLACVSCNPTGVPAAAGAQLQDNRVADPFAPLFESNPVANLTTDGSTAFFESAERLVPADTDGLTDVYEWRAKGAGGCEREAGCLALLSSPTSTKPEHLYAVSPDGTDVFIETTASLLPADTDGGGPSIYDARVNGGFPSPSVSSPCQGDACQGPLSAAPLGALPSSALFFGQNGNVVAQPVAKPKAKPKPKVKKCKKGSVRKRVHGKLTCVKQKPRARRTTSRAR